MKRILMLLSVAAMMAAAMALSGVAQAAPVDGKADAKCEKLAIKTLGPDFNPANYTFNGGTEGNDPATTFTPTQGQPDVICGFGGDDSIFTLEAGDIFLGGEGNDSVYYGNRGTVNGGDGDDYVGTNDGTVNGGDGDDVVPTNGLLGTFNGGEGNDSVYYNSTGGTVNGGEGDDSVYLNYGTFNGGEGDDVVNSNYEGATFNGGEGSDSVTNDRGGTFVQD